MSNVQKQRRVLNPLGVPLPAAIKLPNDDPLESDIEGKVCSYATRLGFYVRKYVSPAHRSVPDRIFCAPARPGATERELFETLHRRLFMIEFKRLNKEPTHNQNVEMETLRGYGIRSYVIDNESDGRRLIDKMSKWYE